MQTGNMIASAKLNGVCVCVCGRRMELPLSTKQHIHFIYVQSVVYKPK